MNPEKQPPEPEIAETLSDKIPFSKSDMDEFETIGAEVCTDQIVKTTLPQKKKYFKRDHSASKTKFKIIRPI